MCKLLVSYFLKSSIFHFKHYFYHSLLFVIQKKTVFSQVFDIFCNKSLISFKIAHNYSAKKKKKFVSNAVNGNHQTSKKHDFNSLASMLSLVCKNAISKPLLPAKLSKLPCSRALPSFFFLSKPIFRPTPPKNLCA